MEFIINLLQENLVSAVTGALVTIFTGSIWLWFYINSGVSKAVREGGFHKKAGNVLALWIYRLVLSKVKDEKTRAKLTEDLNTSGNDFDEGWDLGLRGIAI